MRQLKWLILKCGETLNSKCELFFLGFKRPVRRLPETSGNKVCVQISCMLIVFHWYC